jgi:hypothetical protein
LLLRNDLMRIPRAGRAVVTSEGEADLALLVLIIATPCNIACRQILGVADGGEEAAFEAEFVGGAAEARAQA